MLLTLEYHHQDPSFYGFFSRFKSIRPRRSPCIHCITHSYSSSSGETLKSVNCLLPLQQLTSTQAGASESCESGTRWAGTRKTRAWWHLHLFSIVGDSLFKTDAGPQPPTERIRIFRGGVKRDFFPLFRR